MEFYTDFEKLREIVIVKPFFIVYRRINNVKNQTQYSFIDYCDFEQLTTHQPGMYISFDKENNPIEVGYHTIPLSSHWEFGYLVLEDIEELGVLQEFLETNNLRVIMMQSQQSRFGLCMIMTEAYYDIWKFE